MSLQDQLLKAGLTSKDKAQKNRTEKRKQKKTARGKSSVDAAASADESAIAQQRAAKARAEKAEKDRALNQQREAERQQRESVARIRQLIAHNQLAVAEVNGKAVVKSSDPANDDDAQPASIYRFTVDSRIREWSMSEAIRHRIVKGLLAIVRQRVEKAANADTTTEAEFAIIPAGLARKIQQEAPIWIVVLNDSDGEESGESNNDGDAAAKESDDDPYAEYQVPDDLMW